MCGIAGAIDTDRSRGLARTSRLNAAQTHRGPDHVALTAAGHFALGNTRLAIQDPGTSGNQPFVSDDGRYTCVFNGEIYNFRQLARQYQLAPRTGCDTEVIVRLWEKVGPATLPELRGMYAIAIVDSLAQRLYLARDPFGIKPLHWRRLADGSVLFSSEIRPLLAAASGISISPSALLRYLRFGAVDAAESPFREIFAVGPNELTVFSHDGRVIETAEILPGGPLADRPSPGDLGAALSESIALHLNADVPTALLLSGGVDSATVASVAHRLGQQLECLTVAVDKADESEAAERTARRYGHRFRRVPAIARPDDIGEFFAAMQRPTIDGLNTFFISRAVHEAGFKVALSGLGGDEAVGGYSHFRLLPYLRVLSVLDQVPTGSAARLLIRRAKVRRLAAAGGPRTAAGLSLLQREVLPPHVSSALSGVALTGPTSETPRAGDTRFRSLSVAEVEHYLQPTLLADADSFSMAHSVELRVPLVDVPVFAAAAALNPTGSKPPGKAAIGHALRDDYLNRLASRPKRGFSLPMADWIKGPLAEVLTMTDDPDAPIWRHLDRKAAISAGLLPLGRGQRWAEDWCLAALNRWLLTVPGLA